MNHRVPSTALRTTLQASGLSEKYRFTLKRYIWGTSPHSDEAWHKAEAIFQSSQHTTDDPKVACLYVVIIGMGMSANDLQKRLETLPYWQADGRNHLLMVLSHGAENNNPLLNISTGRAILAQSSFDTRQFRPGFDIILPPLYALLAGPDLQDLPPQVPAKRKFLFSFQGESGMGLSLSHYHAQLMSVLRSIATSGQESVLLEFTCSEGDSNALPRQDSPTSAKPATEWAPCGDHTSRLDVLQRSTFALVIAPHATEGSPTASVALRVLEALEAGAVPVVLGSDARLLPFGEMVRWERAAILLPKARATELHFVLRSIADADVLSLRRQGHFIWDSYLGSIGVVVKAMLAAMRTRLCLPPPPVQEEPAEQIPHRSVKLSTDGVNPEGDASDLELGPQENEPPFPSECYRRNYTIALVEAELLWNVPPGPFLLFPFSPRDPILPSEAQFLGSGAGFRPIAGGSGGTGKEFQEALGGNVPREQFTVVMLTFERDEVLLDSVRRLAGLPYLNRVVIIWNSPRPPPEDLAWPDIGVPVTVGTDNLHCPFGPHFPSSICVIRALFVNLVLLFVAGESFF
uniref:Exostosin-like glycosyltransferase 3 n=1 Tax=Eptatretus burgeri TaxID=7764 RepID=A0A8C4QVL1_EPTBU